MPDPVRQALGLVDYFEQTWTAREKLAVEEMLIHVTHELRHQGQLQVILRLLGKKPPNADWF